MGQIFALFVRVAIRVKAQGAPEERSWVIPVRRSAPVMQQQIVLVSRRRGGYGRCLSSYLWLLSRFRAKSFPGPQMLMQ